jgi:hypothetical protein
MFWAFKLNFDAGIWHFLIWQLFPKFWRFFSNLLATLAMSSTVFSDSKFKCSFERKKLCRNILNFLLRLGRQQSPIL